VTAICAWPSNETALGPICFPRSSLFTRLSREGRRLALLSGRKDTAGFLLLEKIRRDALPTTTAARWIGITHASNSWFYGNRFNLGYAGCPNDSWSSS
jgi:hypothetical protein